MCLEDNNFVICQTQPCARFDPSRACCRASASRRDAGARVIVASTNVISHISASSINHHIAVSRLVSTGGNCYEHDITYHQDCCEHCACTKWPDMAQRKQNWSHS